MAENSDMGSTNMTTMAGVLFGAQILQVSRVREI